MQLNRNGELDDFKFYNSVIKSKARLTYEKLGKYFGRKVLGHAISKRKEKKRNK